MSIPVNCASHLRELEHQIQFWQLAAPELPVWLTRVLETACEYTQNTTDNSGAAARKLVAALEIFHQATAGGHWPTASAVRVLWPVLEETYQIFAAAPDRENPRSLAMVRHSLVNVLIPLNLTSPEFLTQKLQAALAALHEENTAHTLRADLERCLDAVTENVTPEGVQVIGDVLGNWHDTIQKALAMVSSHPAPLSDVSTPLRGALIIEDQWWGDVLEQRVRAALPEVVRVWRVRTLQDALNALNAILTGSLIKSSIPLEVAHRSEAEDAEMPPSGVIEEENDEWSQQEVAREISVRQREAAECEGDLLVFLDLGLPQDEAALRRGHISRAHGKQLLGRLRNYAINARTIVLTSPSEYLPDHLWISQQGIAPEDFILKTDREWDKEIDEALRRALERSHTIRCIELDEENGVVWMDGIEISFASMDFKIVSILCENLKEKPEPQHRRRAYSCAEITERLSEYFDETCEAENIPTHIHTIRRCIHERFNEAGRSISAHRVVATEFYGEEVRYRIVAKQFLRKGQPFASVVSAVTVLVVEDNAAWRNAIAEPLREVGYEVETASDITAAIEVTKSVSPTVLCVDMQLPLLTTDAARDEEGGLRVIERVREIDPEARVVVLT
ncbi:MAG: response regulator transcription factor, partial [Abitibacteriaceae bacterium]|nr:response regulator transcription factor [Abditibacteriaceae bacterium]